MNTILLVLTFNLTSLAFNLPPELLASVCYIESHHNPKAVHHDDGKGDSLGICQIKINTAKMLGFEGTSQQLMLPEVNVYYAAAYLNHQITRYHGSIKKSLVAYNMGSAKSFTHSKYSDKVVKEWRLRTMNDASSGPYKNLLSPGLKGSIQGGGSFKLANSLPPTPQPSGMKHDQDKPDMSLLSNIALVKVAQVMTFGKRKYSANNWRGGFAWSRPLAAAARHLYAYIGGEDKDPETGLSHLAHAICCLMFILEFEDTHKNLDDRYKQGAV